MKRRPIGIFDSGVGGVTVLREIERLLPHEDIIYFGDTARVPYGNKSKATIIRFSTENLLFLLRKRVKMVVIACNTASALSLDYLKDIFSIPVIGVIEAGVNKALEVSAHKKIGIIGTKSTIKSDSYKNKILEKDKNAKVYSQACPLFVPFVEEGLLKGPIVEASIRMYLEIFKSRKVDVIVLGCTHYPLLKSEIGRYLKNTYIVDSAQEVAYHTQKVLFEHGLLNQSTKTGKKDFYVTDDPDGFRQRIKLFLKRDVLKPRVVNV